MTEIRRLGADDIDIIKELFISVFTSEPWFDDWSDPVQLNSYILDLIGNNNSLSLGLYEHNVLVGLALGYIMHWFAGTEYYIHEFCVKTEKQGKGLGSEFMRLIDEYVRGLDVDHIFLQTDRSLPAFDFYVKNGFRELEGHVSLVRRPDDKQ
ncbi:MAG: GNAT family N-acetyltransferase [Ruminococcus sp.]|uniref:GNAT family N-acetyltransferase n=1 Tax=Ruminococcus sp. TaxID=41978 RepID=UPI0025D4A331|nr:GNAT family N-acetyltransferase [Ruminococcus sp.]MCR5600872.1 GNAT family N-acetyltransferase [Ruminococcus sp.]